MNTFIPVTKDDHAMVAEYENRVCAKCGEPIDYMKLFLASQELVDAVDTETKSDLTEMEELIYSEQVCHSCASEYLLTQA